MRLSRAFLRKNSLENGIEFSLESERILLRLRKDSLENTK